MGGRAWDFNALACDVLPNFVESQSGEVGWHVACPFNDIVWTTWSEEKR